MRGEIVVDTTLEFESGGKAMYTVLVQKVV